MTEITLYGKPGCHLCDQARAVVHAVRRERDVEVTEVDITLDPALYARYAERIPVVAVDGIDTFEFHVEPAALRGAIDRVTR